MRSVGRRLAWAWLAGLATAGAAALVLGVLIVYFGLYDTAATSQHSRIVAWAVHQTMQSSVRIRSRGAETPLPPIAASRLLAGAAEYREHCLACHGGPGVARAPWVKGMLPTPPYLIDSRTRWTRTELHTIIDDGVKLTGMPAWGEVLPPDRIEDLTQFVMAMPLFDVPRFKALMERGRGPAATPSP